MTSKTNLQGNLFSKGFPKDHETYYFFTIQNAKEFCKALKELVSKDEISTVAKVQDDWAEIATKIDEGLAADTLELTKLAASDPAFVDGMTKDGPLNLNDPDPAAKWDPPFKDSKIHGVLKVAGNSTHQATIKLKAIKTILGHDQNPSFITEAGTVEGKFRPSKSNLNGREHFGFEDGISQPVIKDIDGLTELHKDVFMQTDQRVIIVGGPPTETKRPVWMKDGSFLVFRKLHQDVDAYRTFEASWKTLKDPSTTSADHFGAKLMGRWKGGAPVVRFSLKDATAKELEDIKDNGNINKFLFEPGSKDGDVSPNVCPLAAHIRKTNPRRMQNVKGKITQIERDFSARILRHGIPYGNELGPSETTPADRGLLFACYQNSIEKGFRTIQQFWINNSGFPKATTTAGFDMFTAQPKDPQPTITLFNAAKNPLTPATVFPKLVTMKGGEYFFAPSISALNTALSSA